MSTTIQIVLGDEGLECLEELREAAGASTIEETIANAISLYYLMLLKAKDGHTILDMVGDNIMDAEILEFFEPFEDDA